MSALAHLVHRIATDAGFAAWIRHQSETTLAQAGLQLEAGQATALLTVMQSSGGTAELWTPASALLDVMVDPWSGDGTDPLKA